MTKKEENEEGIDDLDGSTTELGDEQVSDERELDAEEAQREKTERFVDGIETK